MIVKLNLDSESLKRGLVEHFEKVLFGLVVLFCLLLVYKAVAREGRLSWGPAELVAESEQAKVRIQDAHNINTKVPEVKILNVTTSKVVETPYVPPGGLVLRPGPPLDSGLARRGMPKLFPVRDLQVAGGHGKFAMSSEEEIQAPMLGDSMGMGPGSMMGQFKGQRWVVVTAVFDYKKQRDAYENVFQEASYRSPNDFPEFAYYYVERGEVDPANPSAEPKWVRLNTRNAIEATVYYWNAQMPEVVDPMFIPPPAPDGIEFAFPLGPLQDRMWGPEVAHAPEIPLFEPETAIAGGAMAGSTMYPGMGSMYPGMRGVMAKSARAGKKPSEKPGAEEAVVEEPEPASEAAKMREAWRKEAEKRLAALKAIQANRPDAPSAPGAAFGPAGASDSGSPMPYGPRMPRGPGSYGMMPGSGPGSTMGSMGPRRYPTPSRGMSSEDSYSGSGGSRRPRMGYGSEGYGDAAWMGEFQEPDVLLFRFFDFKVEQGKQYRYRVQLVLANPNYGVNPQYLERDDLGVQPFLNTAWSDPSPVVAVPRDSQALVVSAKGPSATLMLLHFNYQDGEVSFEEVAQIQRGQLLNARNRESSAAARPTMMDSMMPDSMSMGSMPMGSMPMSPYRAGRMTEEKQTVDYLTQVVFLDGAGGGSLPGKDKSLAEPSLAFFLDPNGNLLVRSELDDEAEVEIYKPPEGQRGPGVWAGPEGYPMYGPGSQMDDSYYAKKAKKGSDKGGSRGGSRYQSGPSSGMMPGGYGPSSKGSGSGPSSGYPMPKGSGSGSGRMPPGMMPGMMPSMDMDAGSGTGKRGSRR